MRAPQDGAEPPVLSGCSSAAYVQAYALLVGTFQAAYHSCSSSPALITTGSTLRRPTAGEAQEQPTAAPYVLEAGTLHCTYIQMQRNLFALGMCIHLKLQHLGLLFLTQTPRKALHMKGKSNPASGGLILS